MSVDTFDLSGERDEAPERFVPIQMQGRLIEAEHLARYRWAARVASGGRIIDAGCGLAYGTKMLAESGADEVIGVDLARAVLDSVRGDMPDNVRLEVGDIRQLPYETDRFDTVVCFEVIEHLADPAVALDELARVLAPGGLLLVSSPNRNVHPPVNPHHRHEFLPRELAEQVARRFRNVRLMRQQNYLASAILTDEVYAERSEDAVDALSVYKLLAGSSDRETFTLALASDGPLPALPMLATLTGTVDLGDVFKSFQHLESEARNQRRRVYDLEQQLTDHREVSQRLIEAEQRLDIVGCEERLEAALKEIAELKERLDGTRRMLDDVVSSPSWRWTLPLRSAKHLLENRS
jgi:2-polyprenyl-3-methyl-5-hydroxy-6-metoxy-1,4-benzoquinol methylase